MGQEAFNLKFLKALHHFAWEQIWSAPPGLALAVVPVGQHYYLQGAGFTRTLGFKNPIHANPPKALELWTLDLNLPKLLVDMKTIFEWRRTGLIGPPGPCKFTFTPTPWVPWNS